MAPWYALELENGRRIRSFDPVMRINIHVPISNNSLRYFEYCRSSYVGLCSDQKRLVFHAYCLDKESYKKICQGNLVSQATPLGLGRGSQGHAEALVKKYDTAFTRGGIRSKSKKDVDEQTSATVIGIDVINGIYLSLIINCFGPFSCRYCK